MSTRVVITGVGVVSCIGTGRDRYWDALFSGNTGFGPLTLFPPPGMVHFAGEVRDFAPEEILGKKGLRDLDRSTRLASAAAKLAIEDGRLGIDETTAHDLGVSMGATFGSLHSIAQFDMAGLTEGPRYVNPSHFPNTVINSPASQISIRFNAKGFNTTISTGFCAGLDALCYGADFIRMKRARTVLAGGVEELCEETFRGFEELGCLTGGDGGEPVCCPFDDRRNGALLSEGASVVILEDEDHALQRKALILAEVLGYASSFDPAAEKNFRHSGTGLERAIALALHEAAVAPGQIDYVCSSANSSRGLDKLETAAIKHVFADHAFTVPVSSIKSMVGESFSASGALSAAAVIGAIHHGAIPPTVNYKERDPECDLDYVPNESRKKDVEKVLLTAADPYGHNSALVLGKYRR